METRASAALMVFKSNAYRLAAGIGAVVEAGTMDVSDSWADICSDDLPVPEGESKDTKQYKGKQVGYGESWYMKIYLTVAYITSHDHITSAVT